MALRGREREREKKKEREKEKEKKRIYGIIFCSFALGKIDREESFLPLGTATNDDAKR